MEHEPSSPPVVFRLPFESRAVRWLIGVAAAACGFYFGITGMPGMLVFLTLAPFVVLDARAFVEVNYERGLIISRRAVRTSVVRIEDVVTVRVPPAGNICLMLREGAVKQGGDTSRIQVVTGLTTARRGGENTLAGKLAAAIGVPVVSVHPGVRSRPK